MKKLLLFVLVLILVAGVGLGVYLYRPETAAKLALKTTADGLLKRDEIAPVVNMLQKGSLQVNYRNGMEEDRLEVGGKIYFSKDSLYVEDLMFKQNERTLDGDIYIGEEYCYVNSEGIFNGNIWGVTPGEMADQFENSIFAYNSGSKYAVATQEAHDQIVSMLESYDEQVAKDLEKDLDKLSDRYVKLLMKLIEKYGEYESEYDEVKVGGDRVKARIITVTVDEDAIVSIVEDLCDEIEDDDELREMVVKYGELFEDSLKANGLIEDGEDIEDAYDKLLDELKNAVDTLEDNMGEDLEITVEIVTPRFFFTMMKMNVSVESGKSEAQLFNLDLGEKGIRKTDCIELTLGESDTYIYDISENDSSEYKASLKNKYTYSSGEKHQETLLSVEIDYKKEDLRLRVSDDLVIEGEFLHSSNHTTLVLKKIRSDGEEILPELELDITINEKDSASDIFKKDEVIPIFDISDQELEQIIQNIDNIIGEHYPATDYYTALNCLYQNGYKVTSYATGGQSDVTVKYLMYYFEVSDLSSFIMVDDDLSIFYFSSSEKAIQAFSSLSQKLNTNGLPLMRHENMIYYGTDELIKAANKQWMDFFN